MTNNQIAFWTLEHDKAKTARAQRETERSNRVREQETERSNLAKEAETYRSNLAHETETSRANIAKETETKRANLANERETKRSNVARELETSRSNRARETETNRANLANEANAKARLDEDTRHNYAQEYTKNLETETKAWGPVFGTIRNQTTAAGHGSQAAFEERQDMEKNSVIGKQKQKQKQRRENKERQKHTKSRGSR